MAAATARCRRCRVTLVSKVRVTSYWDRRVWDADGLDPAKLSLPGDALETNLQPFLDLTASAGCSYEGGLRERQLVPTILGTFQEVCIAPRELWQADPRKVSEVVVVGIANLAGFDAKFLAERFAHNSAALGLKTSFASEVVSLPQNPKHALTALEIANHIDRDDGYRTALAHAVKAVVHGADLASCREFWA